MNAAAREPSGPGPATASDKPAPPSRAAAAPPAAPLSLRIDRLVLDGFRLGPRERARLQATVQEELARLLRDRPPGASNGGSVNALRLEPLRLPAGSDARRLGLALARALHEGVLR